MTRLGWWATGIAAAAVMALGVLTLVPLNPQEPVATKVYAKSVELSDQIDGCAEQTFGAWLETQAVTPVLNAFDLHQTDVKMKNLDYEFRMGRDCPDGTTASNDLNGLVGISAVGEPGCDGELWSYWTEYREPGDTVPAFDVTPACDGAVLLWSSGSADRQTTGTGSRSGNEYPLRSLGRQQGDEWCLTYEAYFLPGGEAVASIPGVLDDDHVLCVPVQ